MNNGWVLRVFSGFAFFVLFLSISRQAPALTLDGFDGLGQMSVPLPGGQDTAWMLVSSTSAVGGNRSLQVHWAGGLGQVSLKTYGGMLSHSQDASTYGGSWVFWDGDSDAHMFNPSGFVPVDLTQDDGDAIKLSVAYDFANNSPIYLTFTLFSGSADHASQYVLVLNRQYPPPPMPGFEEVLIPFSNFNAIGALGAVAWTGVTAASLQIEGPGAALDLSMDLLGTNGQCTQVPNILGRVIDDCGVCGGDNSEKDLCGICFGHNDSCQDCLGVPNGGAKEDVCEVCAGDGTSCLDCKGVPHGTAVVDKCGVCGGDGGSCGQCSETDISPMLKELTLKAKAQRRQNRSLLEKFCPDKRTLRTKLLKTTDSLFQEMLLIVQSLPAKMLRCIGVQECIKLEDYTPRMDQYEALARQQYALSKTILKQKRACLSKPGGKCMRTPAECAASQRQQAQNDKNSSRQSKKVFDDNSGISAKVPCVTNVCQH
jgi:hypothetical protein